MDIESKIKISNIKQPKVPWKLLFKLVIIIALLFLGYVEYSIAFMAGSGLSFAENR